MQRSRLAVLALVGLLLLSGCTVPGSPDRFDTSRELGHVGGYAHDDTFAFDGEETLTESQLEAVKYRSMARVEVVRGLKFERDVDLEVISRSEYRGQRGGSESASAFTNELWRGAFVVDGETDVNEAMDDLYGSSVQGYYVNGRIVIIAADADEIRIDRETLVHELVHALQDQRFGLERDGETIDERRAELGLIEGEANYVPHRYAERCGDEWQCLPVTPAAPAEVEADRPFNVGLFLSIYAPYAEGPSFVESLSERGGWAAVDDAHDEYPASTSQVIHPDRYPDNRPVDVDVPDRLSDEWEPITAGGEVRTETVGEATLFGALWANGVIERSITAGATELSPYNYSHPATDGWAGDTFTAYRDADGERTGHVWRLAWESRADADEFADAYRTLLETRGAESVDAGTDTYRIPDGDTFEGAYRVTVDDDAVTIVGAPTVDDLEGVHAPRVNASTGSTLSDVPTAATAPAAPSEPIATAAPPAPLRAGTATAPSPSPSPAPAATASADE
ncbi:Hvo_1808 family surface protein [Haloterrigena salifodinae]|uniref:Hvo_1808 family surface protein n=1 Tax=Haloterrigena salifodinae TaxID=2675099 RepID=A0A8T8E4W5_9EURY|nr:Hvo_1808 family surface protein [Haloterrigena salifodinae]QRV16647.1 Hvo_1808 family surface protein [Haloterrigena salifodinae]